MAAAAAVDMRAKAEGTGSDDGGGGDGGDHGPTEGDGWPHPWA